MLTINLLPYREQKQSEHKKRFRILFTITISLALILLLIIYSYNQTKISRQEVRNSQLQQAALQMDAQLSKVGQLKEQKKQLLARKQLVEYLKTSQGDSVEIFNALTQTLPEGIYLKSVKQEQNKLNLSGISLSGARVSQYMRELERSPIFSTPNLLEVKATVQGNTRANEFSLDVAIQSDRTASVPLAERSLNHVE